jgi:hypothetical protein
MLKLKLSGASALNKAVIFKCAAQRCIACACDLTNHGDASFTNYDPTALGHQLSNGSHVVNSESRIGGLEIALKCVAAMITFMYLTDVK